MSTVLDHETVELLAGEPELLAIADALVTTRPARRRRLPLVAGGAAIAAGLALTFLAPWSGSGAPTLARALAALGPRPVVHVIARTRTPRGEVQTETWYDTVHHRLHTQVRRRGTLVDDYVARYFTPVRSSRIAGFVGTARGRRRWIGPPGAVVSGLPSPELTDFTTRYRDDLKSGRARIVARSKIAGRDVVWLEFRRPIWTIRIAVDAATYEPVLLRTLVAGKRRGPDTQILVAETLPLGAGDFRAPRRPELPRKTRRP
jgi:hypothetical protein